MAWRTDDDREFCFFYLYRAPRLAKDYAANHAVGFTELVYSLTCDRAPC